MKHADRPTGEEMPLDEVEPTLDPEVAALAIAQVIRDAPRGPDGDFVDEEAVRLAVHRIRDAAGAGEKCIDCEPDANPPTARLGADDGKGDRVTLDGIADRASALASTVTDELRREVRRAVKKKRSLPR